MGNLFSRKQTFIEEYFHVVGDDIPIIEDICRIHPDNWCYRVPLSGNNVPIYAMWMNYSDKAFLNAEKKDNNYIITYTYKNYKEQGLWDTNYNTFSPTTKHYDEIINFFASSPKIKK
jgi:hypothetical protein